MRSLALSLVLFSGCVFASAPAPIPPKEYKVPLVNADGTMGELTVEDHQPEKNIRIIFCKETGKGLFCVADDNGRVAYLSIPASPNDKI